MAASRIVVSNTQLETFESCPRRYQYVYRHTLTKSVGVPALWSRELLHPSLAELYATGQGPDWPALWDRYCDTYGLEVVGDGFYTLNMAKACFVAYVEQFYRADDATYAFLRPETLYFLPLEGDPEVLYLSKPDVVFVDRQTGRQIPVDFKASKRPSPMLVSALNRQFLGQALACQADRMLVNVFTLAVTNGGKPKPSVVRHELAVTKDLADEWVAETRQDALAIVQCDTSDVWPKRAPTACLSYGERCPYVTLCEAGALRLGLLRDWPKRFTKTTD